MKKKITNRYQRNEKAIKNRNNLISAGMPAGYVVNSAIAAAKRYTDYLNILITKNCYISYYLYYNYNKY